MCVPGTNIVLLQVNYSSKTNEQTCRKREQIHNYWMEVLGGGRRNWRKVVKWYTLPVIK